MKITTIIYSVECCPTY